MRRVRIAHAASFSRIADHLAWINRPIGRKNPARHQPMFDGVVMDVIHVTFEFGLVPYLMFPESSLPQVGFTAPDS